MPRSEALAPPGEKATRPLPLALLERFVFSLDSLSMRPSTRRGCEAGAGAGFISLHDEAGGVMYKQSFELDGVHGLSLAVSVTSL